jgi:hypothetical protein
MAKPQICFVACALLVLAALPTGAQMGRGAQVPGMKGVWNPVIGSGAEYDQTSADGQAHHKISIAVIGKEDVNGSPGYWVEFGNGESSGQMNWMQALIFFNGAQAQNAKVIVTMPGRGPMEMDGSMFSRGGQPPQQIKDIRDSADRVGNESVSTPAGTFDCERWRTKDGTTDVWISPKVTPWGMVKTASQTSSMVLAKILTDQKSHITGTPQKFDPSTFGRSGN